MSFTQKKDIEHEQALCSLDFYKIPLCPKTWSTSSATVLAKPIQNISIATYESTKCSKASIGKKYGKFKVSMNQKDTSGTFSKSSLVYYHLSRYLNTVVSVPVAVYRTMDRKTHLERVSSKAKGLGGMNIAGWKHLVNAEQNPSSNVPVEDLFTVDLKTIYGTITKDTGERYGAEFNSPREAAWGAPQSVQLQTTAAFVALRTAGAIKDATSAGERSARKNATMNTALGTSPVHPYQMALWMQEASEIALLDYMLSQQDRIGNIDFEWKWVWLENGGKKFRDADEVTSTNRSILSKVKAPSDIAVFKPILVQKTYINDNDAGVRAYANFAAKSNMLSGLKHFNLFTYRQLLKLNQDLQSQGEISIYLRNALELSSGGVARLTKNTDQAASILIKSCETGGLQLDLNSKEFFEKGTTIVHSVNCRNP
ncbi:MAG: hypothetical protein ACK41T_05570 [Pseudobdellovibrio sp.]